LDGWHKALLQLINNEKNNEANQCKTVAAVVEKITLLGKFDSADAVRKNHHRQMACRECVEPPESGVRGGLKVAESWRFEMPVFLWVCMGDATGYLFSSPSWSSSPRSRMR
jgi:hypothetical protein